MYALIVAANAQHTDDFFRSALLIVFAMFFDTMDGRVARATRTQSAFGVQLDSLADLIAFGAAPALLLYQLGLYQLGILGVLGAFAFVVSGAIRLARFNILVTSANGRPKVPGKYIVGLPIPGAAGILVSLIVADHFVSGVLPTSPRLLLGMILMLSFFMVSTIRFRSFKDLALNWRSAILVTVAVGGAVGISIRFHISLALVWLLISYVAIGVAETILHAVRPQRQAAKQDTEEEHTSG